LRGERERLGGPVMSAAEIIEMIEKLPPEERAEVLAFIKAGKLDQPSTKVVSDADFERAAKRVFADNKDLLRRLAQ
jgi:hypothetical protein